MKTTLAYIKQLSKSFYGKFLNKIIDFKIFRSKTLETAFTTIYKANRWGSLESVSGGGSTLSYTVNIRRELPFLFKKYSIRSLLDAPCGDFNWMSQVIRNVNVNYIGGDIVLELINRNNHLYSDLGTFYKMDITKDKLPDVDLMIVRDCLFHLNEQNIMSFFNNFKKSNIKYLLTTTHINDNFEFLNSDIKDGDFRLLDLHAEPFLLPKNVLYAFNDYIDPFPPRKMILIERDAVPNF